MPRLKGSLENSAGRSGSSEPPVPAALGVEALLHVAVLDVAGLRHEAVDDAVEGDIVVGAFAHQLLDLLDMLRRQIGPQLDGDVAVLQRDDHGVFRIGGERRNAKRTRERQATASAEASFFRTAWYSPDGISLRICR